MIIRMYALLFLLSMAATVYVAAMPYMSPHKCRTLQLSDGIFFPGPGQMAEFDECIQRAEIDNEDEYQQLMIPHDQQGEYQGDYSDENVDEASEEENDDDSRINSKVNGENPNNEQPRTEAPVVHENVQAELDQFGAFLRYFLPVINNQFGLQKKRRTTTTTMAYSGDQSEDSQQPNMYHTNAKN